MSPNIIVDGGNLVWRYGTIPRQAWESVRIGYRAYLICIDSSTSWRKNLHPGYKGKRALKRSTDPEAAARRRQVEEFRDYMLEDTLLRTCYQEGVEADDLVAIHYMHHKALDEPVKLFSIDKDMLQVPGIWRHMYNLSDERVFTRLYYRAAPDYWKWYRSESDVLLAQCLFGDKSDSVPRLLDRYDHMTARWVATRPYPFEAAYSRWGQRLIDSLSQLLIPMMNLHDDYELFESNHMALLNAIQSGDYWDPQKWPHDCSEHRERDW